MGEDPTGWAGPWRVGGTFVGRRRFPCSRQGQPPGWTGSCSRPGGVALLRGQAPSSRAQATLSLCGTSILPTPGTSQHDCTSAGPWSQAGSGWNSCPSRAPRGSTRAGGSGAPLPALVSCPGTRSPLATADGHPVPRETQACDLTVASSTVP